METGGSHFPVLHAPHGTELKSTTLWPSTVEGQSAESDPGESQGPGGRLWNYLEAVGRWVTRSEAVDKMGSGGLQSDLIVARCREADIEMAMAAGDQRQAVASGDAIDRGHLQLGCAESAGAPDRESARTADGLQTEGNVARPVASGEFFGAEPEEGQLGILRRGKHPNRCARGPQKTGESAAGRNSGRGGSDGKNRLSRGELFIDWFPLVHMQIKGLVFVSDTDIDMARLDEILGKCRNCQGQGWDDQEQFHNKQEVGLNPMQIVCNR